MTIDTVLTDVLTVLLPLQEEVGPKDALLKFLGQRAAAKARSRCMRSQKFKRQGGRRCWWMLSTRSTVNSRGSLV
jgi:hypothetical protein